MQEDIKYGESQVKKYKKESHTACMWQETAEAQAIKELEAEIKSKQARTGPFRCSSLARNRGEPQDPRHLGYQLDGHGQPPSSP